MRQQKMNPEVKAKWVAALRSGKYKQGQGGLRSLDNRFCCLGILCYLHAQSTGTNWDSNNIAYMGNLGVPPMAVYDWAGLSERAVLKIHGRKTLPECHNDKGRRFATIAAAIEAQL